MPAHLAAPEIVYAADGVELRCGNALEVLPTLPPASVDVVLADPPYSSGGATHSARARPPSQKYRQTKVSLRLPEFAGDARDQLSHIVWSSIWLGQALRATRPGGLAFVWSDWRQLAATITALQAGGWTYRGVVVWEKTGGRPCRGRFRLNVEFAAWGSAGDVEGHATSYPSAVVSHPPLRRSGRIHIAQKPVPVLEHLLSVARPGGVVLDPFAGSASTLVAARGLGMDAIGIELLPDVAEQAAERLRISSLD